MENIQTMDYYLAIKRTCYKIDFKNVNKDPDTKTSSVRLNLNELPRQTYRDKK